ncbi:hypothetical protein IMSHALPRED_011118 [Imshaugia aleurites]|uniref:Uncharacterized protein n=1 Tax=Imshaugia aleurites TaxID=172621 RepID=A0A8H3G747_9LECA|nr:hypothetical protein IMSHALPRED_011118 [Imshaugia aleurites]
MGWLWTSTKDPSSNPPPPPQIPSEEPPPSSTTTSPKLSAFLSSDASTTTPDPSTQPPLSTPHSPSSPSPHTTPRITRPTTLPSTLSCRTCFDAAFHCQSFGGQFAHVYRYGTLRSCSEHWSDFWFCVRTNRGLGGAEAKKNAIRRWAAEKEWEKYGGERASSEDVWEGRREVVRGAFAGDWGAVEREAGEREREREGETERGTEEGVGR